MSERPPAWDSDGMRTGSLDLPAEAFECGICQSTQVQVPQTGTG